MHDNTMKKKEIDISVIIPVSERHDNLVELFYAHQRIIRNHFSSYEVIFVLDGNFPQAEKDINSIIEKNDSIEKIAKFAVHEQVSWLLVVQEERNDTLMNAISRRWYMDPSLINIYPNDLKLHKVSSDGKAMLFQFVQNAERTGGLLAN